jgi:hypothetical protein
VRDVKALECEGRRLRWFDESELMSWCGCGVGGLRSCCTVRVDVRCACRCGRRWGVDVGVDVGDAGVDAGIDAGVVAMSM